MARQQTPGRAYATSVYRSVATIAAVTAMLASAVMAAPAPTEDKAAQPAAKATAKPAAPSISIELRSKDTDSDADEPKAGGTHSHGAQAHIQMGDRDFDSFANAMETAPWIVGLVFLVVGSIFLTPLILLVGIIWYKLRKTRLQNDALLKLAERGVVPAAQVADAVASGQTLAASELSSGPNPGFQQAVTTRRRAAWSDLRKGVILTMIGLSFVFYSLAESATANWVGLLLMFLGIGYIVLWWLEDRHLQQRELPRSPPGGTTP
jgi:Domain of unknown function (DUF6249)